MEDRRTDRLYLELTSMDLERYLTERVTPLMETGHIQRASWWKNIKPGRHDLPRRIEEFHVLGIFEPEDGSQGGHGGQAGPPDGRGEWQQPPPTDGVRGLDFRRTTRPAQGSLNEEGTNGLLLVLVSPKDPDGGQELRDWADFVHIRRIAECAVPGYSMITPYENQSEGPPRFLHLYEMHSDDPEATFKSMMPLVVKRMGGGRGHPPFDEWASHPQLGIDYVSTFTLLGRTP